jgi:hypothetical protein
MMVGASAQARSPLASSLAPPVRTARLWMDCGARFRYFFAMAKIVNLRTLRKQKARDEKRREGDANAARHGLGKAQKDLAKARAEKARRDLDGHERE